MSWNAFFLRIRGCALCLAFASAGAEAASSADLDLSATIPQVACTVSFSPASPLSLGDIASADLSGISIAGVKKVTLTLGGCGLGDSNLTPTVTLAGTHPDAAESGGGTNATYMFKDPSAGSTSYRYFIAVGKRANPAFTGADVYKEGDAVFTGPKGDSGAGGTADLYMGVTCAGDSFCKSTRSGSLSARLTFTFAYK